MKQRIQYRAIRVARARMYNQIARFINDDDVIIFVNDIERNILRSKRASSSISTLIAMLSTQHFFFRFIANFAVY